MRVACNNYNKHLGDKISVWHGSNQLHHDGVRIDESTALMSSFHA